MRNIIPKDFLNVRIHSSVGGFFFLNEKIIYKCVVPACLLLQGSENFG
jgi:hypothetical protein